MKILRFIEHIIIKGMFIGLSILLISMVLNLVNALWLKMAKKIKKVHVEYEVLEVRKFTKRKRKQFFDLYVIWRDLHVFFAFYPGESFNSELSGDKEQETKEDAIDDYFIIQKGGNILLIFNYQTITFSPILAMRMISLKNKEDYRAIIYKTFKEKGIMPTRDFDSSWAENSREYNILTKTKEFNNIYWYKERKQHIETVFPSPKKCVRFLHSPGEKAIEEWYESTEEWDLYKKDVEEEGKKIPIADKKYDTIDYISKFDYHKPETWNDKTETKYTWSSVFMQWNDLYF